MQEKKRNSVSGRMKSLEPGEFLVLDKRDYKLSSIRVTASTIKQDNGKGFAVSVGEESITVTCVGVEI